MTLPEEALLHRAAVGHLPDPEDPENGPLLRAPRWQFPRSVGPAGLISATARDVVSFARLHLGGGLTPDGERVLSEESVAEMRRPQVRVPRDIIPGLDAWGLGWMLFDWGGRRVIGHDGVTIGQRAFLRVVPDADLVAVLLTNSPSGGKLYEDLFSELFAPLGIEVAKDPEPLEPGSLELDPSSYAGEYGRMNFELNVSEGDGGLEFSSVSGGPLADLSPEFENAPMRPASATTFLVRSPSSGDLIPVIFSGADTPRWLHMGARAHRRSEG